MEKGDDARGMVVVVLRGERGTTATATEEKAMRRKGRASIQEILEEATCTVLKARACKLHAAGREDIDVRCLGNGRPFALEVLGVHKQVTSAALGDIMALINTCQGLNKAGDVQLLSLEGATKSTWSSMQKVAEEKDKHYCCVVYSSNAIERRHLDMLEMYCKKEHQEQCRGDDGEDHSPSSSSSSSSRSSSSSSGTRMAIQPTPYECCIEAATAS